MAAASQGSPGAEVGDCISFKPVPWAVFSEQRRDCEPKPLAKTPNRFLLLLRDRALQALRRGRWETPAELETRHWESHSFVAHSSCTAVSFKQSLLSVT